MPKTSKPKFVGPKVTLLQHLPIALQFFLDSEQKLQQYDTLVTLNTNTLSFIANQIINFK